MNINSVKKLFLLGLTLVTTLMPGMIFSQVKCDTNYYYQPDSHGKRPIQTIKKTDGNKVIYSRFHYNGNLESVGYSINGQSEGIGKKYYQSGMPEGEDSMASGVLIERRRWYENGTQESVEKFKQDLKNGKLENLRQGYYFKNHENGKPMQIGVYLRGERNGKWIEYYQNGKKSIECTYVLGKISGLAQQWFENGNPKSISYHFFAGDEYDSHCDGRRILFFSNGQLESDDFYLGGRIINYYMNGNLKSVTDWEHRETGHYKTVRIQWLSNGDLVSFRKYSDNTVFEEIDDLLKAKSVFDLVMNQPSPEGKINSGLKDGIWTTWYDKGHKHYEENYDKGVLSGLFTVYYYGGNKYCEINLKNGVASGKTIFWDIHGKILYEYFYVDGEKMQTK